MIVTLQNPHIVVDLHGCDRAQLDNTDGIRGLLLDTAQGLGATVVGDICHRFSPHGVTGILAIAESHLSVHTWVESGYAAADLFLCNAKLTTEEVAAIVRRMAEFFGSHRQVACVLHRRSEESDAIVVTMLDTPARAVWE